MPTQADILEFISGLEWPELEDFRNWALLYPDFVLLGEIAACLLVLVFGVGWLVNRIPVRTPPPPGGESEPAVPDFETRLGLSRADLAEVGLPLVTPPPVSGRGSVEVPITSLVELSTEHLLVIARYCLWKGDTEGARDAIAPIMVREDVHQRRAALALLEGR